MVEGGGGVGQGQRGRGRGCFPSPGEEEGGQEGVMGVPCRFERQPARRARQISPQVGPETPLGWHHARHAKPTST